MSVLEKKLYQLIIVRLNGDELSSPLYCEGLFELVQKGIGGFIIFGGQKDEVKELVSRLQSASKTPLFIASDIERGVGQQIEGCSHFPSQMAVAAAIDENDDEDIELLRNAVRAVADEAVDIGINVPLIPVLDININPDNPIICTRAFSDKPEDVAWYGSTYIKVIEGSGLLSCAKHFPGHGDTDIDSHISLPIISKPLNELMQTDILPFREAVNAGVSSIMAGHLSIPAIDTLPTTISRKMIELLRGELGYEGLIMTDALNMDALEEIGDVAAKCINAGYDIILHPADAALTVEELKRSVLSDEINEKKIDMAVERILKYKSKINGQRPVTDYKKHVELFQAVSDRSITLVKDTAGGLPLTDLQNTSCVYIFDENRHDLQVLKKAFQRAGSIAECNGMDMSDTVVFALFTSIAAWEGSSGIRNENIDIIKGLIANAGRSIVISFGSPYVLRHFGEADVLIAAYDPSGQAQASVIKCLKGEIVFQGRLPVEL
jgi:beta-glucosidase-like glycosyl hydrolase